jgi:hypothetical protein
MAERKTEKINVWLTPEQVAWLKTKKNVSDAVRAMVAEAMSMDALVRSVKKSPGKNAAADAPAGKTLLRAVPTLVSKASSRESSKPSPQEPPPRALKAVPALTRKAPSKPAARTAGKPARAAATKPAAKGRRKPK